MKFKIGEPYSSPEFGHEIVHIIFEDNDEKKPNSVGSIDKNFRTKKWDYVIWDMDIFGQNKRELMRFIKDEIKKQEESKQPEPTPEPKKRTRKDSFHFNIELDKIDVFFRSKSLGRFELRKPYQRQKSENKWNFIYNFKSKIEEERIRKEFDCWLKGINKLSVEYKKEAS